MSMLSRQSVALLQSRLPLYKGKIDGFDGPKMQAAIRESALPLTGFETRATAPLDQVLYYVAGVKVDVFGDPDYPDYFRRMGIACVSHGPIRAVPGVFVPEGVLVHHTGAQTGRARIPPNRMIDGRAGLAGPIVQFAVSRDMTVDCITNGRAHHAGQGDGHVLAALREGGDDLPAPRTDDTSGNTHFIGIEVDHTGKIAEPLGEQWKPAANVAHALCKLWGWGHGRVLGHRQWTSRKTDPIISMPTFHSLMNCPYRSPVTKPGDFAVVDGVKYKLVREDS